MQKKYLLVLGLAFVVCISVGLAGISSPKRYQQWEYGIFQCGKQWIWCEPEKLIIASSQHSFAEQMKMRMSRYNTGLPIHILNHLGEQGWELLRLSKSGNTEIYWFKRPI